MKNHREEIINELTKNLFDVERWPHYKLMFSHLNKIINNIKKSEKVAILERCYIYNGFSIFSSLFDNSNLDIYDFIPLNSQTKERQNYQFEKLDFLPKTKTNIQKSKISVTVDNLNELKNLGKKYEYFFIPNVLHHHPNPFKLIEDCRSLLTKGGYLYIFDATLREDHQKPDDFLRLTKNGIIYVLENNLFEIVEINSSNSPIEALIYTIDQVIQYDLPSELLSEINKLNEVIKNQYKYTIEKNFNNNFRKFTSFPVAYSVLARCK
tara:strand:+ start:204 stop:1001 length:798 start_codon:yes stop_codon:yes gene_type:complete